MGRRCHRPTPLSADRLANSGLAGGCGANRRGGSRGSGPDVSFRTKTRRREGEERACQVVRFLPALRGGSGMPSSALRAARPRCSGDIALVTTGPRRPRMGPQGTPCAPASGPEIMFRFRGLAAEGHRAQRNGIQGSRAQDRDDDAQRRSRRRAGAPRMEGGSRCQRANRNVEGTSAVGKRKAGRREQMDVVGHQPPAPRQRRARRNGCAAAHDGRDDPNRRRPSAGGRCHAA
jgi:hypothetical protein